jgi:hypothetical protein
VEGTFLPDTITAQKYQSFLFDQKLFNLGSGRLCTVKVFEIDDHEASWFTAILTGMEVVQCDGEPGKVKVIRHLSRRVVIDLNDYSLFVL